MANYPHAIVALLSVCLTAGCADDREVRVSAIDVTGFGIFDYESVRNDPDDTSSVGAQLGAARALHLAAQTDRIPIRPGLAYGVRFVARGSPQNAVIDIRVIMKSTNACVLKASNQVVYHNDSLLKVRIGESRHIGGRFPASEEEKHCVGEAKPGTNTLQLYYQDRKLAEQVFQIVAE